jgi:hypothetical protein
MNFNYAVIGSHPEVEHLRHELPHLMAEYLANPAIDFARVREIVALAEHFYGLTLANADDDVFVLIDQIKAADQELQFS